MVKKKLCLDGKLLLFRVHVLMDVDLPAASETLKQPKDELMSEDKSQQKAQQSISDQTYEAQFFGFTPSSFTNGGKAIKGSSLMLFLYFIDFKSIVCRVF